MHEIKISKITRDFQMHSQVRQFLKPTRFQNNGILGNRVPCANQRLRLRSDQPRGPLKLLIQSGNPLPMSGTTSCLMPDFLRLVGCEMINSPLCFAVAFPSVGFSQISYLRLITCQSQPSFSAALRLTDAHTLGKYLAASRKLEDKVLHTEIRTPE